MWDAMGQRGLGWGCGCWLAEEFGHHGEGCMFIFLRIILGVEQHTHW